MRADIEQALRGRSITFLGANREKRRLENYLHPDEVVHDMAACKFGEFGGRALMVATDERIIVIKDGWVFKNSKGIGYGDLRSIEITTGLLFAKIQFHGEGMDFEVTKVGRFSADHIVKLVRGRIGARYAAWERQREQYHQQLLQQQQSQATQNTPVVPVQGSGTGAVSSVPPVGSQPLVSAPAFPQRPNPVAHTGSSPTAVLGSESGSVGLEAFVGTTTGNNGEPFNGGHLPAAPQTPSIPEGDNVSLEAFLSPQSPNQSVTEPAVVSHQQAGRTLIQELQGLDDLRRAGAVTDEEYNEAKRRLLS